MADKMSCTESSKTQMLKAYKKVKLIIKDEGKSMVELFVSHIKKVWQEVIKNLEYQCNYFIYLLKIFYLFIWLWQFLVAALGIFSLHCDF